MNASKAVLISDLRLSPAKSSYEFAHRCADRLDAGDRRVTLFGRHEKSYRHWGTIVTAVFQTAAGELKVFRGQAEDGKHYPSLTHTYPVAHIFERELWEQTGLQPDGHPWLKPVRFEGARQQRMTD